MINKSPIYQQINNALKELIAEDRYAIGDKFLTERAICEQYEVSRATANKALSSLVSQGLLEFKKGVGTFIKSKPSSENGTRSLVDFYNSAKEAGKIHGAKVLNFAILKARNIEDQIAGNLKLNPGDDVIYFQRISSADDVPMMLEYCYITARFCSGLQEEDLKGSLAALLPEKYGLTLTSLNESIQPVILSREQADYLDADPSSAALELVTIGRINYEEPLWWQKTIYRPKALEFLYKTAPDQISRDLTAKIIFKD